MLPPIVVKPIVGAAFLQTQISRNTNPVYGEAHLWKGAENAVKSFPKAGMSPEINWMEG